MDPKNISETDGGRARLFQIVYLVCAVVATVGWAWLLGYIALTLLGY